VAFLERLNRVNCVGARFAHLNMRQLSRLKCSPIERLPCFEASWRSGYVEDCKSSHPSSILGEASNFPLTRVPQGPDADALRQRWPAADHVNPHFHRGAAAEAAHHRKIDGQDEQPERQHPEPQHRQKPQKSAQAHDHAENEPQDGVRRNGNAAAEEPDVVHGG
jgi:hypothetical protein